MAEDGGFLPCLFSSQYGLVAGWWSLLDAQGVTWDHLWYFYCMWRKTTINKTSMVCFHCMAHWILIQLQRNHRTLQYTLKAYQVIPFTHSTLATHAIRRNFLLTDWGTCEWILAAVHSNMLYMYTQVYRPSTSSPLHILSKRMYILFV